MKIFGTILLTLISVLTAKIDGFTQLKSSIEVKKVEHLNEKNLYAKTPDLLSPIHVIANYIEEGAWHLLKPYFKTNEEYNKFLSKLSYKLDGKDFIYKKEKGYNTLLSRIKPYSIVKIEGNTISLFNLKDHSKASLQFVIKQSITNTKIESVNIELHESNGVASARTSARANAKASLTPSNFVLLPYDNTSYPEYVDHFNEMYGSYRLQNKGSESIPFQQIDFDPLKIQFKWCKKIGFIRKCGTETFVLEYGPVLSQKDIPNQPATSYFSEVVDVTAYATALGTNEFNPTDKNYILTSVIVDAKRRRLTFLREGVEPWHYGLGKTDIHFKKPVAAKVINDKLYLLDTGGEYDKPSIQVFEVYNTIIPDTDQGDIGLKYIGAIDHTSLPDLELVNVVDISGFEGETPTDPHTLLVADRNGLHSIEVDPLTGLPSSTPFIKTFSQAQDPLDEKRNYFINNIRRFDARKRSTSTDNGNVVLITKNNEIISFSSAEVTRNNSQSFIHINYYTALNATSLPINLAYMFSEAKWYVIDYYGKMHTLTKDGRYISGGGKTGKSEIDGELYFPTAITPNPIEDQTSDFRYRYIIANQWGVDTGFKLFAPDLTIADFKIFENLQDQKLVFTFTTSNAWEYVERATGVTLESLVLNGSTVDKSLWNTQIVPGTSYYQRDNLTSAPNVMSIAPDNLTMLKRGWNKAKLSIKLFMKGVSHRVITKEVNFYWLPSAFTPSSTAKGEFKLNKNSILDSMTTSDFIYKPIVIGSEGALFAKATNIYFSKGGHVTFEAGSTFFNKSSGIDPLQNIKFTGSSQIELKSGAFACISGTTNATFNPETDYATNITFRSGYSVGVNPSNLSEYAGRQCNSPCNFLASGTSKAEFTYETTFDDSTNNFMITANPEKSTYAEKIKWEVEKIVPTGHANNYKAIIVEGKPLTNITQT